MRSAAAEEAKLGFLFFFFFLTKKFRDQKAHAKSKRGGVPVILAFGRLRQDVLHESEAGLATSYVLGQPRLTKTVSKILLYNNRK